MQQGNHNIGSVWRNRGGTASVEFVLILPLLALLLFGMIDVGRLLMDYHTVSKSVRDATRYLTRIDPASLGLNCAGVSDTSAEVDNAKNLALTGSIDGSKSYLLSYWTDAGKIQILVDCFDNSTGIYSGYFEGDNSIYSLTMTAEVGFPFMNGWVLGMDPVFTMFISHKEVHFGQ